MAEQKQALDIEERCAELDATIAKYYKNMEKEYPTPGLFALWCDENGFDDESLAEELNGDPKQASLLEMDEDFPLKPAIPDETKRIKKIIDILKYCYEFGEPPVTKIFDPSSLKLRHENITAVQSEATAEYEQQTPGIFEAVSKEEDIMYFLAARNANNGYPFIQYMVDAYSRDKMFAKCADKDLNKTLEWVMNSAFGKKLQNKDKEIVEKVAKAIDGYVHRISPKFQFQTMSGIDDSAMAIAGYIVSTSQFIQNLLNDKNNVSILPFQVDLSIAVKNVVGNTNDTAVPEISGGDDDDDDDDE
eukprot:161579_1